ncbi:hypothetical protein DFQ27_007810 [Actinomortierella ambigua]|uniref:Uncharacterized protein n=1 Tax=Actinomortierella ambigua TaxID=1343610 RepID=A0A9P6TZK7_9FUNG|nr:hypothetical protein DFQ26_007635 [Actinomortierella ambigua]KAG0252856.1 hypothetical protein DFQ27_007810 [Actinomortierella ambigua]
MLFAFITRGHWQPKLEELRDRLRYTRLNFLGDQESTFQSNIEEGLTSNNFDIQQNLLDGDNRAGLEDVDEIRKIMKKYKCNFDQARLIRQQKKLEANGIDPRTGLPTDPKAVMFKPRP